MAGAINFIGSDALFGRNWGCISPDGVAGDASLERLLGAMSGGREGPDFKHLHFECCYYQAIEAAIERGLSRVEAGAQGEHKISRGYLPVETYSAHYIANASFKVGSLDMKKHLCTKGNIHICSTNKFRNVYIPKR